MWHALDDVLRRLILLLPRRGRGWNQGDSLGGCCSSWAEQLQWKGKDRYERVCEGRIGGYRNWLNILWRGKSQWQILDLRLGRLENWSNWKSWGGVKERWERYYNEIQHIRGHNKIKQC